jgi:hypothetical protein
MEYEMARACSTHYSKEEKCQKERNHWEDLDVGGKLITEWQKGIQLGHSVTGGHKYRDLVLQVGG